MRQIIYCTAFWVAVVIAIRLAVCFPKSLLARILFSRHGPIPGPREARSAFSLRLARFYAGWTLQCTALFALGATALDHWPILVESLYLTVLFLVVIPVLGALACAAALLASTRALWLFWVEGGRLARQGDAT
jgi:hypothetical protein